MTKYEWEKELTKAIHRISADDQKRVMDFYNELFADKIESGMSEYAIVQEFGNPYDVAEKVLADYPIGGEQKAAPQAFADSPQARMQQMQQQPYTAPAGAAPNYGATQQQTTKNGVTHTKYYKEKKSRGAGFAVGAVFATIGLVIGYIVLYALLITVAALVISGAACVLAGVVAIVPSIPMVFTNFGVGLVQLGICVFCIGLGMLMIIGFVKLFKEFNKSLTKGLKHFGRWIKGTSKEVA